MKSYTITVNGVAYDVTVEEKAAGSAPAAAYTAPAPVAAAPAAAAPAASAPAPTASAGETGSIKVEAGAAGKIYQIPTKVGQEMKPGDTVIILEAMKMEIPVVAPEAGTIVSIDVAVGDMVEAGQVLATLD